MFNLEIKGLDLIRAALHSFPERILQYLGQAGDEAAKRLLKTQGLRKYPPLTAANRPPTPYYKRGQGTQYKSRNLDNSEHLGERWYVRSAGGKTTIGNSASYAKYVHGDEQARAMAKIGWRKLVDVTEELLTDITQIYQLWVDKLIRDLGL